MHPNLVSGVMVCKNDKLDRLLYISDPIVNPQPELMDLVAILNNTVGFAHKLGNKQPKVAHAGGGRSDLPADAGHD